MTAHRPLVVRSASLRRAVCFYREQGFVRIRRLLDARSLEFLRRVADQTIGNSDPPSSAPILQRLNVWRESDQVFPALLETRIGEIACLLTGASRVRLWHDQVLIKPGPAGRPSPWHQDQPFWPMNETGALSCWMALDDVNASNGCLAFIPRSHTWGRLPIAPQDLAKDLAHRGVLGVRVPLRAGDCTFHHGLTVHSAAPNTSSRPRRAFKVVFMPEGTTYRAKNHAISDQLALRYGDPLVGEMFPVIGEMRTEYDGSSLRPGGT